MERIKVNISGSATIPNDQWEQGFDLADTLLWAKQNDSINMEIPTDTHLHVPVARPSVVQALGGVVEVDDSLVQSEGKETIRVLAEKIGNNALPTNQQAQGVTSISTWFSNQRDIDVVDLRTLPNLANVTYQAITNCDLKELIWGKANCGVFGGNSASIVNNCPNLSKVTFPEGFKTYGGNSNFKNCPLKEINFPSTTEQIYIYDNAGGSPSVYIYATTPPSLVFGNNGVSYINNWGTIYVPQGTLDTYKAASGWSNATVANKLVEFDPTERPYPYAEE